MEFEIFEKNFEEGFEKGSLECFESRRSTRNFFLFSLTLSVSPLFSLKLIILLDASLLCV